MPPPRSHYSRSRAGRTATLPLHFPFNASKGCRCQAEGDQRLQGPGWSEGGSCCSPASSTYSFSHNLPHTVTVDFSVFLRTYILIVNNIYQLCVAYISSLCKPYRKSDRIPFSKFVKHICRVCRTCTTFIQLTPQAQIRNAPSMTIHSAQCYQQFSQHDPQIELLPTCCWASSRYEHQKNSALNLIHRK